MRVAHLRWLPLDGERARDRVRMLARWGWLKEMYGYVGGRPAGSPVVGPGELAARRSMASSWAWEPDVVCRSVPTHQMLLRVRHAQQGWWPRKGGGVVVGYLLIQGRQVALAALRRTEGDAARLLAELVRRPPKGAVWVVVPTHQDMPTAVQACTEAGVLERASFTTDANLWHDDTPIAADLARSGSRERGRPS